MNSICFQSTQIKFQCMLNKTQLRLHSFVYKVPYVGVLAVLECIASVGGDVSKLTTEERTIAMPLDKPVEIGRHHQPNFYEKLLKDDSTWGSKQGKNTIYSI